MFIRPSYFRADLPGAFIVSRTVEMEMLSSIVPTVLPPCPVPSVVPPLQLSAGRF